MCTFQELNKVTRDGDRAVQMHLLDASEHKDNIQFGTL